MRARLYYLRGNRRAFETLVYSWQFTSKRPVGRPLMPFISTSDNTNLFYTDWAAGDPVVFVHAWALNSDMWAYQIPDLVGAGLRCVAYDRRGHGRSDVPGQGYDYDTFADDLATVLEHLDLDDVTLVGYSAGCGDVVRYVTRHGDDRVARAILIAPTLPMLLQTPDNPDGLDPAIAATSAEKLKRDVPQWCADNAPAFFGDRQVSPGLADWVTRQIVDTPLKVLLDTAALFAASDFRSELGSFEVPALLVHGDLDASAPIDITGRKAADLIPDSRLVVYEGAGHGLYAADHERLNGDVLAFVRERVAV
jgi:non-heme chloroperoxidase